MEHEQPINAYVCQFCKGSFDRLENLNKHVQQIHTARSSTKQNRLCPLCGTQCIKNEGYRNHLRHIHGHNEEGQVFTFKGFNDFLVWKNELEKKNYCKYVMRAPPKKLSSGDKIHIYQCDSSVRSMKEKKGGVAVKETCPAVISATESAKTRSVKIEHWNTHVGHIIPVEDDELDAAIGSLGTTEIILTTDDRYHGDGQSTDSIFFLSESNDGSLSETFIKELPKKTNSMFKGKKTKILDSSPKSVSQKFSYKKDPTKKSSSFNYSLASVACMKPSVKKTVTLTASTTTQSVVDSTNSPTSSTANIQSELPSEKINAEVNIDSLPNSDCSSNPAAEIPKSKEDKEPTVSSTPPPSTNASNGINKTVSNHHTFGIMRDGPMCGQMILLNSLPTQNGDQNVFLYSSPQNSLPVGSALSNDSAQSNEIEKPAVKEAERKSNLNSKIVIVPKTSDKGNGPAVQGILSLSKNVNHSKGTEKTTTFVPTILKKAKKTVQKQYHDNSKTVAELIKKNIPILGKRKPPPEQTVPPKTSAASNVTNSAGSTDSVPSSSHSNVQSTINVNTSTSSANIQPVSQLLLNSFPPGQTFMSINNNLIPIGSPAGTLLPPNFNQGFVLASSVPSSPVLRPARSLINYSPLAPRPPIVVPTSGPPPTTYSKALNKQISAGSSPVLRAIPPQTGAVPVLLIPHTGNQINSTSVGGVTIPFSNPFVTSSIRSTIATTVGPNRIQPIISNPLVSGAISSNVPKPLTASGVNPILTTQLLPGTQIISSPILPSGPQIIPAPLLTSPGLRMSRPVLQSNTLSVPPPLIGQPAVAPIAPSSARAIISTTVSNTIKVQKVQLPFSTKAMQSFALTKSNVSLTSSFSEPTQVSSVLLNTEPISSTPAISIPPLPTAASQKPGTLIFESSGDVYMLEPVEDNLCEKDDATVEVACNKVDSPVPNSKETKINSKSSFDKAAEPSGVLNKKMSSSNPQASIGRQSIHEARVEGKLKSLSPRKNIEIKNGVQIKSVIQEKRPMKDDDVEILKKVKYYQMEMKYLSSQAECKRLKLELAKALMKNKEIVVKNNGTEISSDLIKNQVIDVEMLHTELPTNKNEPEIGEASDIEDVNEVEAMDTTDASSQLEDAKDLEVKDSNLVTNESCAGNESKDGDGLQDQTKSDSTLKDQQQDVSIDDNQITTDLEDILNNKENHLNGIESDKKCNLDSQNKDCNDDQSKSITSIDDNNLANQTERIALVEAKVLEVSKMDQNLESNVESTNVIVDQLKLNESDVQLTNICESVKEKFKDSSLDDLFLSKCASENRPETEELTNQSSNSNKLNKDVFVTKSCRLDVEAKETNIEKNNLVKNSNTFCPQPVLENQAELKDSFDHPRDSLKSEEEPIPEQPCDETQHHDTIKALESQYGKDKPSDIYTMIRTSVLRSLYDDMKILCEENKKLFGELQNCRSQEKLLSKPS